MALTLACGLLAGCGDSNIDLIEREQVRVAKRMLALADVLNAGSLPNARIINTYANSVARDRPELEQLTNELRKEATTDGLKYQNLRQRLEAINTKPRSDQEAARSLDDLVRIEAATDQVVFNDSLADIVNVLADLSGGKLARVEGAAQESPSEQGAGSHLVGNPAYGQWRRDSRGLSFWEWYGAYALFSNIFWRPRPYYYDTWYRGRGWSYYGDVGRHYYGTRTDQSRWSDARRRNPNVPRKTYRNIRSERRLSTYGRSETRSAAKTTQRASSYSGYGASARGTSRRSSFGGGSRRGK